MCIVVTRATTLSLISTGNTLVLKTDVTTFVAGSLQVAVCPHHIDWGSKDSGRTRYRTVLAAQGPIVRASNTTLGYQGIAVDAVASTTSRTSLASAPLLNSANSPNPHNSQCAYNQHCTASHVCTCWHCQQQRQQQRQQWHVWARAASTCLYHALHGLQH